MPAGTAIPLAGFTVALKVTREFCVEVVVDADSVVIVLPAAGFAVTTMAPEVDARKFPDPA